jgi:hypothetical protein
MMIKFANTAAIAVGLMVTLAGSFAHAQYVNTPMGRAIRSAPPAEVRGPAVSPYKIILPGRF